MDVLIEFSKVPQDARRATKYIMDLLLHRIYPILTKIRGKLQSIQQESDFIKIRDVYLLASSQIKKSTINFLDVLRAEIKDKLHLLDNRQFCFERIVWCLTKLNTIEEQIERLKADESMTQNATRDSIFESPMYFVNWIDYTFEILGKLSITSYKTDYKGSMQLYEEWKEDMVEHVSLLHMCMDELLMSAMTLRRYCLEEDQPALKARCQVVMREAIALFNELIKDDITRAVKLTPDRLKLPINPSNVNVLIDVLKDVLYVLETNTNSALLAVLIHCYVNCASPIDVIKEHFVHAYEFHPRYCACFSIYETDECKLVNDFDLYNERLAQIGAFALSCSSDQKRLLTVRSALSSLEALESHLVPAIAAAPHSTHSELLVEIWRQEVRQIRDAVFLIVDPAAFARQCKLFMQEILMEMKTQKCYDNRDIWIVINTGGLLCEFFSIYKKHEPDALEWNEEFERILVDLDMAQKECKAVSFFFTERTTFYNNLAVYTKERNSVPEFGHLTRRVNLLYTIVKKINRIMHPKDEEMFASRCYDDDVSLIKSKNATHTITNPGEDHNDSKTARTNVNMTRSVFFRTTNVETSSRNVLSKLTEHLKRKRSAQDQLSFSNTVRALFYIEPYVPSKEYWTQFPREQRLVMKAASDHCRSYPFMKKLPKSFPLDGRPVDEEEDTKEIEPEVLDMATSLQISAVLDKINDITSVLSRSAPQKIKVTMSDEPKPSTSHMSATEFCDINMESSV